MRLVKRLNDMGENTPVISHIVKFQGTVLYPVLMAMIAVVSGLSGREVYLPCIWLFTALIVFSGLFAKDFKVFLPPAFIAFYGVGLDVPANHFSQAVTLPGFSMKSVPHFVVCLLLIASALIFRLYANGALKDVFCKRGICFWGLAFLSGAMLLNGAFSSAWTPMNIVYGVAMCVILMSFYCIFLSGLSGDEETVVFACKSLIIGACVVVAQMLVVAYRLHLSDMLILHYNNGQIVYNRYTFCLAWGASTTIPAAVVAMAIPAAIYLARSRKLPVLSYSFAVAFWAFTVLINSRTAMFFGGLILLFGIVACCIKGKNKKPNRIFTAVIFALGAVAVGIFVIKRPDTYKQLLDKLAEFMRLGFIGNDETTFSEILGPRYELWVNAIRDFLSAPLFGVGFSSGVGEGENFFRHMCHNIILELLGALGIAGLLAFLIHMKHMLEVAVRRFSVEKLLLLCVPISIIAMSLLDNFFFYPNFQIAYAIFLALAELRLERDRRARIDNLKEVTRDKPRVVFTFIEAGKGHIIPTQTIYNAFERKYGDRAELVRSEFFTETDNADMQKTEILFTRAVKGHNRTPVLGALCKLGNLIAGDSFAMQVLLSMTISGRKTAPLAVKHVEELDADLIYAAHWSIPYYVNKLRVPRPYTICFCPDVYSNGAFNTDCNEFLISSAPGYRRVSRTRMYAGGNITQIPFPIREEIESMRGEDGRRRAREELGIDEREFVVALSDGGYGLARLEKTVNALLRSKEKMTVIALCGVNHELYLRLCEKKCPENVRLIPVDFTNKVTTYIAAADVYAGKSGANSMAEPAALGVPIIVTKCATYIESGIKNYYVRDLGGAVYIPSARRAARRIERFAAHPEELAVYRNRLLSVPTPLYDAEASADLIWQRLCELKQKQA